MKIDFTYPDGATPLTNDELFDLVPPYVTTQGELNAVEQLSIAKGLTWLSAKHFTTEDILTEPFTWGGYDIKSHSQQTTIRQQYIQGLREADKGNISLLLEFIRGIK